MAHILFEQLLGVTCSPDHGSPSHKGVLMAHILFEQLLESQPLPRGGKIFYFFLIEFWKVVLF